MSSFSLQTMLPVMLSHTPSGASIKQLEHFGQLMKSGHFRKFDRGYLRNQLEYNRMTPPDYDLSKVKVPVALYYSMNDMLVSTTGVDRLARELPHVIDKYLVPMEKFNHLDFLWAIDVKTLVYNRLVRNIRRVENFKLKHSANLANLAATIQQQQHQQQQRQEILHNQHTLSLTPQQQQQQQQQRLTLLTPITTTTSDATSLVGNSNNNNAPLVNSAAVVTTTTTPATIVVDSFEPRQQEEQNLSQTQTQTQTQTQPLLLDHPQLSTLPNIMTNA